MATDVKRGAPSEDGVYELLMKGRKVSFIRFRENGIWRDENGVASGLHNCDIIAHRKHKQITLPKLEDVKIPSLDESKFIVLQGNRGEVDIAVAYRVGDYLFIREGKGFSVENSLYWHTELNKEQCESLGYKWPLKD